MNNNKGPLIAILFVGIIAIVAFAVFLATKLLPGSGTTTTGVAEINYLGVWDESSIYEPLIKEYEGTHANVKIKYTKVSFNNLQQLTYKGAYQTAVEERLANGTVDIVRVHQSWIPRLQAQLEPAPSAVMTGEQAKQLYYPAITDAVVTTSGKVYGSPQIIDGLVLFYNKEILATAQITDPRTATKDWDIMLDTAKKVTVKNANGTIKTAGINLGSVSNVKNAPEILLLMMTQSNIPVVSVNNNQLSATFATDATAAAINRFYEFSRAGAWSSRMEDDLLAFSQGRLAFMIAPSWRAIDIVSMNANLRFDALPLPVLPGANPGVAQYLASFWIDTVSKKSKYTQQSWEFLKWLSEPAQMRRIYKAQTEKRLIGNPYPRIDMAGEQKDAPFIGAIIEMAPSMKSWALYDNGVWEEVLKNELLTFDDKGDVDTATLVKIQTKINDLTFLKK
jgi:ABC-type glycerol-3-phosphate transport system substrate-binding protein